MLGTGNRDKARELRAILAGLPYDIRGLKEFDAVEEPEETGQTFEDNALLKARYYGGHFNLPCIADDSGIEVDALDGAPGVYSARYAGPGCTYADNNEKLLDALADCLWHERTARFVCVAAFVAPDGTEHVLRGTCEGYIAAEPLGDNGFGYDPIFVPMNEERTFAEMRAEEKEAISHRGQAFKALRTWLAARAG